MFFLRPQSSIPQRSICSSKIEAQSELDRARVIALRRNHAEGLRTLQVHRRIGEIHVIEQVEELGRKGKRSLLGDCSLLGDAERRIPGLKPAQSAAAGSLIDARLNRAEHSANRYRVREDIQAASAAAGAGAARAAGGSHAIAPGSGIG